MPLSVGDRLARYEIRGLLGAGGMGEVYRAYDHRLDREVANGIENPIWVLCIPTLEALFDEPRYLDLKRRTLNLNGG
jgi:serine/threonine protein kinase